MPLVAETLTVRELCTAVSAVVADALPDEVWVKGAISGLKRSANGHVYFDLIEPTDDVGAAAAEVLPVALFNSKRTIVNSILRKSGAVRMTDGLEIRIRGKVAYYPAQSRIQLVMSLIDPAYTTGQLAVARQALLDKLRAEGTLRANAEHAFPVLPLRVGLVTSAGSAAFVDFEHELGLSGYAFTLHLFDARVQGADAVTDLAAGIRDAGRAAVDVVVVIRGGGARSDLQPFDSEQVARAIATCDKPVVVGVGHEIDHSVADDVAHTSAKTPTAAAAVLVEQVRHFEWAVSDAADRLAAITAGQLEAASATLADTGHRLAVAASLATTTHANRVDTAAMRLGERTRAATDRAAARLDGADIRLRALDPAATLARGWSIVHTADGRLVRAADEVSSGETLVTTTGSGTVLSTVTEVDTVTDDGTTNGAATTDDVTEQPAGRLDADGTEA